jgi:hypothetical protein
VINLERTLLEVSDTEKELKWLRSTVGSSEKEYELNQKKIAELRMELERERLVVLFGSEFAFLCCHQGSLVVTFCAISEARRESSRKNMKR